MNQKEEQMKPKKKAATCRFSTSCDQMATTPANNPAYLTEPEHKKCQYMTKLLKTKSK